MPLSRPMGGLVGAATATLLAAGLTSVGGVAPTHAAAGPTATSPVVAALAAPAVDRASHTSAPRRQSWGRTFMSDKVLRGGCHRYAFRYKITAPNDEWLAQIFLVNPRGKGLGTQVVDAAYDPPKDRLTWKVCRPTTVYGKHKVKMRVTYSTYRETHTMNVKTTTFRFNKPRRHR